MAKKAYPKVDKYEKLTKNILTLINDDSRHLKFKDFIRNSVSLRNPITGSNYNGGNVMNTLIDKMYNNYYSFDYVTFKQAKDNDLKMKKGSKACPVYFYTQYKKGEENEEQSFLVMKSYSVFNLDCFDLTDEQKKKYSQIKRIDKNTVKTKNKKLEILKELPTFEITSVGRAFYVPSLDSIHMPELKAFKNVNHWNEVFLHELTHWTGHDSRLDRKLKGKTSTIDYSKEELIAELGSFFLCLDLGIKKDLESGSAYLRGYLKKSNSKDLFEAMNKAIKAIQYLYEISGITEKEKSNEK